MRYTYFPKQELKFMHPENMFRSFFLDGWSDRAVRWVNVRFFDAADSERSARPESPTSPNAWIGTYRENKTSVPNARGRIVNPLSSDELDSEEKRRVTVASSLHLLLTPEQHRVEDILCVLGLLGIPQYKRQQFLL